MRSHPVGDHILHLCNEEAHHTKLNPLNQGPQQVLLECGDPLTVTNPRQKSAAHRTVNNPGCWSEVTWCPLLSSLLEQAAHLIVCQCSPLILRATRWLRVSVDVGVEATLKQVKFEEDSHFFL